MSTNKITCKSIIPIESNQKILDSSIKNNDFISVAKFLSEEFHIDITSDKDIICGYERDWSNIEGNAQLLTRPKSELECAIVLRCCQSAKIPITISAGRTNLTGSATPNGLSLIHI